MRKDRLSLEKSFDPRYLRYVTAFGPITPLSLDYPSGQ